MVNLDCSKLMNLGFEFHALFCNLIKGLIPKEDESLDSIENAVENEISSTAEVRKLFA